MSRLRSFLYSRNHDTVIIASYMDKNCHRCHLLSLFPIFLQKKAFQRLFSKKPFSFLHISLFECAKFAYVSSEYADHFLFVLEISRQNLLSRKDLLIILQVSLQQLRCIQSIRALLMQWPQWRQSLIFIIFAWTSGVSWRWDGDLLRRRDILAQVLISMPAGHGMQ